MTPRTTMQQRLAWLKLHPKLWRGYEGGVKDRWQKQRIVLAMREAGLYSEATNNCDIHIIGLIRRIREDLADRRALGLIP